MLPLRSLQALICSLGMLNHRLEDGFRLCSRQQSARPERRQPALFPACPSAAPGLGFYLFSALKGEFSPSASLSSWIKLLDAGKGRSLLNPAVGVEVLLPGGRVSCPLRTQHTLQKTPYLGAYRHKCTKQPLYLPTRVCRPRSFPN